MLDSNQRRSPQKASGLATTLMDLTCSPSSASTTYTLVVVVRIRVLRTRSKSRCWRVVAFQSLAVRTENDAASESGRPRVRTDTFPFTRIPGYVRRTIRRRRPGRGRVPRLLAVVPEPRDHRSRRGPHGGAHRGRPETDNPTSPTTVCGRSRHRPARQSRSGTAHTSIPSPRNSNSAIPPETPSRRVYSRWITRKTTTTRPASPRRSVPTARR